MTRYIIFLRGINVSGKNLIKMEVLKELLLLPGFENLKTYIQSGNIAFDAPETDDATLQATIEKVLEAEMGNKIAVVVRKQDELDAVLTKGPFSDADEKDGRKLYIAFFNEQPDKAKAKELEALVTGDEALKIQGREAYFLTPGYGNTKYNNTFLEKKLGISATTRNRATVLKMATL